MAQKRNRRAPGSARRRPGCRAGGSALLSGLGLAVILIGPLSPARAQNLQVKSAHEKRQVGDRGYLLLRSHEMMVLQVTGPTQLGLRVRELTVPGRAADPVDLTVVRDDKVQGTVRFRVEAGADPLLSQETLIRIDVPAGRHSYRLLASGPRQGIVVAPFSGADVASRAAVVATPAGDKPTGPGPVSPVRRRKVRPKEKPPQPAAPDIMAAVQGGAATADGPQTFVLTHQPQDETAWLGPGTRSAATIGGMLLLGAAAMSISARVQQDRAAAARVQIVAGEYYDRSQRTHRAAAVTYSLAGGALITALVLWFVEEP